MIFRPPLFLFFFFFINLSFCQDKTTIEKKYTKSIKRLVKNKKVKAAFEHIVSIETKTLKRHIALTEIEAPPFKEEKRAAVFAEYYRDLGMDSVWIDSEGNVLGLLLGSEGKQTVALDAHLDTVFPEGTNVQIVSLLERDHLRMRVWERGVGHTLASGSSACASAVAASRLGLTEKSVKIDLDGGQLDIEWLEAGVWMAGESVHGFSGSLTEEFLKGI